METVLIIWNIVILAIWIIREVQNFQEKKDLMNRVMSRDYATYAKFEKPKPKPKQEYPGYMTDEQMAEACARRDDNARS